VFLFLSAVRPPDGTNTLRMTYSGFEGAKMGDSRHCQIDDLIMDAKPFRAENNSKILILVLKLTSHQPVL